jgi:hypothetical protein
MMSSEDIKRLNLVEKLEAEVESLKAQLRKKKISLNKRVYTKFRSEKNGREA